MATDIDSPTTESLQDTRSALHGAVVSVIAGLAAAWIVAGSAGLFAHPLRRILTLLALGACFFACQHLIQWSRLRIYGILAASVASVCLVSSPLPQVGVFAGALMLAVLASLNTGRARSVLLIGAGAIAVFGVYRTAYVSIPWLWHLSNSLSYGLGRGVGLVTTRPMHLGPTFAGFDNLVLMGAL